MGITQSKNLLTVFTEDSPAVRYTHAHVASKSRAEIVDIFLREVVLSIMFHGPSKAHMPS